MKKAILCVKELCKTYNKGKIWTVENISFNINEGEIVGLVGRNGAGKSTILKSITGILSFEKGEVSILGYNNEKEPINAKKNLGYVPDVSNAFSKMTGMEYLNFVADIFNVNKIERQNKISEFEKFFPLKDALNKMIESYSHGMKQKISIMASLISSPKLWILDEPTTGLDHQTTQNLIKFMQNYAKRGNAVLFSSHNLDIVDKISDRIVMINHGTIVLDEKLKTLLNKKDFTLEKFFMEKCK